MDTSGRPSRTSVGCQGELIPWESARRWSLLTESDERPTGVAESFDRWRLRIVKRRSRISGEMDAGSLFTDSNEYTDAGMDPRLEETIRANEIEVLVIDPWAVYFAGNENSNDEVEAARTSRGTSLCATAWRSRSPAHRQGGNPREPEDSWRGASRLADWASTRVT